MLNVIVALGRICVLALIALAATPGGSTAQEAKTGTIAALDGEEERADRRACAMAVCPALYNREPAEGLVACSLHKTWQRETLVNLLGSRPSWAWGDVRCRSLVRLDRAQLAKAVQEPEFDAQLGAHDIRCHVDNGHGGDTFAVRLRPKITFKEGKATDASLHWGGFLARPSLWTALWSIRAFHDLHGFLHRAAVDDINEFIATTCMEVKEAWQAR